VIRVLLIDDHALVRAGLARLIASDPGLEVVGQAGDGSTGATLARDLEPDVALVDLAMPGLDGIETTRRVLAASPRTQVVVLTAFSDRVQVLAALDAGARGYLLKDAEPDELLRGIRAAARGESPLAPKAAQALITSRRRPSPHQQLTDREQEILALIAQGQPNKVIAQQLDIAEKTVKNHVTRIFETIGVTDRTQAALWAQKHFSAEDAGSS
jgi:DNA-binding NarL/FixJ family response regulator